ncbi:Bacterial type II and III secretion system protein [Coleofasciculus chthonoplastes PCC 7420]|uniref:Bacterial type II and III secretion system protein n=1 Tax=Coleofasciculus chthonoplastes PCC 7420 TaxID=118168 RepID=B4VRN7_9CYAN|nr:type IV pilus secretin family protein [Coleofasciculus chthonoplastes]EDX75397.1 Bacterial type II and III secretion system protein [Coleofasciculus chthonoplastes PCC 7420]
MRQEQLFSGIAIATAVSLSISEPVWAATAEVTAVRLNPRGSSLELILETQAGDQRPQVFPVNRGKDWVADIVNVRLNLPEGNSFRQDNPMAGITAVTVSQIEPNSIRVTVSGDEDSPQGQILQQESQAITLGINPAPSNQAAVSIPISSPSGESVSITPPTLPSSTASNSTRTRENASIPQLGSRSAGMQGTETINAASSNIAAQSEITTPANFNLNPVPENQQNISIPVAPPPRESVSSVPTLANPGTTRSTSDFSSPATRRSQSQRSNSPPVVAQTPTPESPEPTQAQPTPVVPAPSPDVLVPDPQITIDGVPALPAGTVQPVSPAPPFLPRAVAPPVGDIAVSNLNAAASEIDLGTAAVVPRLSLREAPIREVLALLARSAGLNLAFAGAGDGDGEAAAAAQETISLDLENEPVQDVFNYVLQLSGLQANRRGRTIFVGARLPQAARNLISRTLRLNQVNVADASAFLGAQGAETQRIVTRTTITIEGEGADRRRLEETTTEIRPLKAEPGEGPLLLTGLGVATDERLNSITLIGEPRQVEIASALLTQLDLRRRQVAINVKIVDINLLGTDAFNTSFSFGIGDGFFVVDQGAAVFNYGEFRPPTDLEATTSAAAQTIIPNPFAGANTFLVPGETTQTIPGTGIDTLRILNDAVTPEFRFNREQGEDAQFFRRLSGISTDPFTGGITEITLPEPNVIQTNITPGTPAVPATPPQIIPLPDGTFQVIPGTPGTPGTPPTQTTTFERGTRAEITSALPSLFQFPKDFLAQLQAQITSGNAKILTDPTIVVQEGQTATVNLTQEVVGNIRSETESADGLTTRTVTAEIREAGLILELIVDRIDDNGFVTLAVNPEVTSIGSVQNLSIGDDTNQIALLNTRELTSGQIRLRDGQTLILSGIIQESDRTTVRKVPILGDLPILGALFRSTERQNQRQEVIVLLTPQILDDSERGAFGYNYTPGREAQEVLQRRGFPTQGGF